MVFHATLNVLSSSDDKESESQMLILVRNIILQLSTTCAIPAQVLGSEKHEALRTALSSSGSEKRQKQILRSVLVNPAVNSASASTSSSRGVSKPISNLSMPLSKPQHVYDDTVLAGFNLFECANPLDS